MTSLTPEQVSNIAEELRIRLYEKHMGFKPHTRFSELEGTRLEKWLDLVKWAEELLVPANNRPKVGTQVDVFVGDDVWFHGHVSEHETSEYDPCEKGFYVTTQNGSLFHRSIDDVTNWKLSVQ